MQRVYAGTDATITASVTTGGTFTAEVRDAINRPVTASASETGGTATVTIAADNWRDGASGFGRVQIMRENGGTKTIEASEIIRILPGLEADKPVSDYMG